MVATVIVFLKKVEVAPALIKDVATVIEDVTTIIEDVTTVIEDVTTIIEDAAILSKICHHCNRRCHLYYRRCHHCYRRCHLFYKRCHLFYKSYHNLYKSGRNYLFCSVWIYALCWTLSSCSHNKNNRGDSNSDCCHPRDIFGGNYVLLNTLCENKITPLKRFLTKCKSGLAWFDWRVKCGLFGHFSLIWTGFCCGFLLVF